jgi:hypothetical protein
MLSVIMLNVILLSVVILNIIFLRVSMLTVIGPFEVVRVKGIMVMASNTGTGSKTTY